MRDRHRPSREQIERAARRFRIAAILTVLASLGLVALFWAFPPNKPVKYTSDLKRFYYGSIGADISGGLPIKVLQVLPGMFPEYLPDRAKRQDYTAFGLIQEPGRPMPIGFSTRTQIVELTALNCATCHTGQVRAAPDADPMVIAGMPANTFDLLGFFTFLFRCAADERFTADNVIAALRDAGLDGVLDGLLYRFIVPLMKDGLLEQREKLAFVFVPDYTPFGPGRVNTFDTFKFDQFAAYYARHGQKIGPDEIFGIVDFPSIWNQTAREGLYLHWDGNNSSVRERNFSAAIGAGAEPQDMDTDVLFAIEDWLMTLPPPEYPFEIDREASARGEEIYERHCFHCHDFDGAKIGQVVPIEDMGTDRHRLDSYTQFLLEAQQDYTAGYSWAFRHFRKTHGYATHPLDGIWARAPYLHNGAVPSMWDLLSPAADRPKRFTTGGDVYDQQRMGFAYERLTDPGETGFADAEDRTYDAGTRVMDTSLRGNDNQGHSGPTYGTVLSDAEKHALIEYLKTL